MFFDTHAHLNDDAFLEDLELVIERSFKNKVEGILVVGYDVKSSEKAIEISRKFKGKIFAACAIHPHDAQNFESDFKIIEELSKEEEVVAIGETGLDFYRNFSSREAQIASFEAFIDLAIRRNLPLIFHVRKAFPEVFKILEKYKNLRGVFHSFSGGINELKRAIELNFYVSFSGSITYGSKKLELSLKNIPLNRLLFETDCPYLIPRPLKGRNEPSNLLYILNFASSILNISAEELGKISTENALRLFNLE
ncbi:MAG: TatD family hydrolase [Candidatus Hydrothermales bacterium]